MMNLNMKSTLKKLELNLQLKLDNLKLNNGFFNVIWL